MTDRMPHWYYTPFIVQRNVIQNRTPKSDIPDISIVISGHPESSKESLRYMIYHTRRLFMQPIVIVHRNVGVTWMLKEKLHLQRFK